MIFKPKLEEKRWSIKKELELIEIWEREGLHKFKFDKKKPVFSIDTPPPYASGSWHVAAAAHYSQFDMFARYFRLKGYNVLFPFGIDRNGLPIEVIVEQEMGIRAREVNREYFIELCKTKLDVYEKEIINIVRRMGMLANYLDPYRTDSPEYRSLTQATFIELWKKGLIYEDERPTIWCPVCHTPIAEAEIEYVREKGKLYYIKFPLISGGSISVATTRPELLGATAALLYHPDDERYIHLKGERALIPLYENDIPIFPHPIVDKDFGSGIMMLSSFGDLTDVRLFRELNLTPKIIIDKNGFLNKHAGKYRGLSVKEARIKIINDLKEKGYLERIEEIERNIPTCWRSKNPVEFISTRSLYLKQLDYKKDLLILIEKIKFLPEFHKRKLVDWIESLSIDWAITRTRFYGTEVPLWYCRDCGEVIIPEPGKYYQPWKDPPPINRCKKCGSNRFKGDERTFDTWFDSSISALYISGYLKDKSLFNSAFPVSVRPQGIDIVRTWLYYTLLRVYQLTKKPAFKMVRLSGMGLDEKGRPMHKHLGNIIPPMPIFNKYGADAFRIWSAGETKLGFDYRYSNKKLESAWRFITKFWNVARFVSIFPVIDKFDHNNLMALDKQILVECNKLIKIADEEYSNLDTFNTIHALRNFTWNIFASHYIELVKSRAYNSDQIFSDIEQRSAWYTLHTVLKVILLVFHPIAPFITDYIWRIMYNKRGILQESFPEPIQIEIKPVFDKIMTFNSLIWKFKDKHNVSLKYPIKLVRTSDILEPFEKDLKITHNIRQIYFNKNIEIEETEIML